MKITGFNQTLNLNDMAQQDSPIPMADDRDDNKKSNAIELHDEGLENVFKAILEQEARELKKILNGVELEKSNCDTDQDNE